MLDVIRLFVYGEHTRNTYNGVKMKNRQIKFDEYEEAKILAFGKKYTMTFSGAIRYLSKLGLDKHEQEAAKPSESIEVVEK
jgi:hypothetical protein